MARLDLQHAALLSAVRDGDLERVRRIVGGLVGVGIFCQRLALLQQRGPDGLRAEDVAEALNDGSEARRAIAKYLSSERLRMELFE